MEYEIPVKIEHLGVGEGYAATSENFPGFLAHGQTLEEAVRKADVVLRSMLEAYRDKGVEPPIKARKAGKIEINICLPYEITKDAVAAC
jgi:predicted RNase H-like HicB family nuclease